MATRYDISILFLASSYSNILIVVFALLFGEFNREPSGAAILFLNVE